MEFFLITPEKLKVSLDARELEDLGISYDSLDYADPLTKRLLISLLEQGKEKTGFSPRNARLFIEVFPSEEGGCILFFTCLRTGQHPLHPGNNHGPEAVVFAFEKLDVLLDAAVKVYDRYSHRIFKSSLYAMEGSYRLVVYPLDYSDNLSVLFLSEFAPKTGEGEILHAFIAEHGKLLVQDTALDTLAKYF